MRVAFLLLSFTEMSCAETAGVARLINDFITSPAAVAFTPGTAVMLAAGLPRYDPNCYPEVRGCCVGADGGVGPVHRRP